MADDTMNGYGGYGSPASVEFARMMAAALLKPQQPNAELLKMPGGWMHGIPAALNALSGARYRDQALKSEMQGRSQAAGDISKAH